MPDVNLSTLSRPELRRLLDTSRARGNATLAYQILQEMAVRREGRGKRASLLKRPAEPRIVAVDLDDPLEPANETSPPPVRRPPAPESKASTAPPAKSAPRRSRRTRAQPRPIVVTEPTPPPPRPRSVWDDDPPPPQETAPEPDHAGLKLRAPALEPESALRALRRLPGAGFAGGLLIGLGLGWWVADIRQPPPPRPAPAATLQITGPEPQPAAPVVAVTAEPTPAPAPETPPDVADAPATDLRDASSTSTPAPEEAAVEAVESSPSPAVADLCAAEPTPADRTICGDPDLRRLQRELRQAYAEALAAHQDRDLLRQRQLAWADARKSVTDPARLAELYEARIRKLNAATAVARQGP